MIRISVAITRGHATTAGRTSAPNVVQTASPPRSVTGAPATIPTASSATDAATSTAGRAEGAPLRAAWKVTASGCASLDRALDSRSDRLLQLPWAGPQVLEQERESHGREHHDQEDHDRHRLGARLEDI